MGYEIGDVAVVPSPGTVCTNKGTFDIACKSGRIAFTPMCTGAYTVNILARDLDAPAKQYEMDSALDAVEVVQWNFTSAAADGFKIERLKVSFSLVSTAATMRVHSFVLFAAPRLGPRGACMWQGPRQKIHETKKEN